MCTSVSLSGNNEKYRNTPKDGFPSILYYMKNFAFLVGWTYGIVLSGCECK